jgi:hypothetical protein
VNGNHRRDAEVAEKREISVRKMDRRFETDELRMVEFKAAIC